MKIKDKPGLNIIFSVFLNALIVSKLFAIDSTSFSKKIRFHTYFGISKSNYFYSRSPNASIDLTRGIDNSTPLYTIGIESLIKLNRHFFISTGLNYNSVKFRPYYKDFVNTNLLGGSIYSEVKHTYLSIPLALNLKIPISEISSMYFFIGAESFKTLNLYTTKPETISVYLMNGNKDPDASINTNFKTENFSFLRVFTMGSKFEFNQFKKNRFCLSINYYLMSNYFPIYKESYIYVGNKNYEVNNYLKFEGMKASFGYIW